MSYLDGKNYEIYVMNADGSNLRNLSNQPGLDSNLVWSPDGSKLAFLSDREGGLEVFTVNPDGSDLHKLTKDMSIQTSPAWSPDGSQLVFASRSRLYALDIGRNITIRLTRNEIRGVVTPAWSADGSQIVFAAVDGLHVLNADGSHHRNLTGTGNDFRPTWQPCAADS
jgi:Tol biopolymer transport system component